MTETGPHLPARQLVRTLRRATLATQLAGGDAPGGSSVPYASLVTVTTDLEGAPLLLLSRLADHTRNLDADPRLSLLFDGTEGFANPQQGPRVTLQGRAERSDDPALKARFLARHPAAKLYADFTDFGMFRVEVERIHWVGGFGRAVWLEKYACPAEAASAIGAVEAAVLERLNATAGLVEIWAAAALPPQNILPREGAAEGGGWRAVALDPDGIDLELDESLLRLNFDHVCSNSKDLDIALKHLTEKLRPV